MCRFLALLGGTVPISPIILTAAADRSDQRAVASSVGFIYTCYGLSFISPLIGGWLAQVFGLELCYIYAAILLWIGMGVALLLPKGYRKKKTDSGLLKYGSKNLGRGGQNQGQGDQNHNRGGDKLAYELEGVIGFKRVGRREYQPQHNVEYCYGCNNNVANISGLHAIFLLIH